MLRVCPQVDDCPSEDPVGNFSSEADDSLDYLSTVFAGREPPPLLHDWTALECGKTFVSQVSQLDADLQAAAAAILCINTDQNPDLQLFLNAPQTCCVPCGDGSDTCFVLPGGLIVGTNQDSVNAQANQIACALVNRNKVCISNISGCTCLNQSYSATLTATVPVQWSLIGGSLPPGLVFSGGFAQTALISGIPVVPGQYTFQIRGQTLAGPYSIKTFTITVLKITTTTLPQFNIGVPYSYQLNATGGSGNYVWKVASGTLPPGITLSPSGLLSGTPT